MPMSKFNQQSIPKGYVALVALLVVAVTGLVIGISVSLRGIDEIQISFGKNQSARARFAAESCVEEGLSRLRDAWSDVALTLPINQDSCILNIVTAGATATLHTESTVGEYSQQVTATVDNSLTVLEWQEE